MWVESVATGFVAMPQEPIDEILETVPVIAVEIHGHIWVNSADDSADL